SYRDGTGNQRREGRFSLASLSQCGCLSGITSLFIAPIDYEEERIKFEKTVTFLRSVPLFKKQLPSSQLPKVARDLVRKVWRPCEKLVRQGEVGRAFFLIEDGVANIIVANESGKEDVRATLYPGDYFGGHTLVSERANVGTVVAKGPRNLVTLSMSRKVFEDSGLKAQLTFPKRAALYFDRQAAQKDSQTARLGYCQGGRSFPELPPVKPKGPEVEAFLLQALRKNANLRALLEVSDSVLQEIATAAEARSVPKGTVVAKSGQLGQEFFVIKKGCFHALADVDGIEGQKSAETTVAQLTMTERLKRKQAFLKELHKTANTRFRQSQSMMVKKDRGPQAESDEPESPARQDRPRVRSGTGRNFRDYLKVGLAKPTGEDATPDRSCASGDSSPQAVTYEVGDSVILLSLEGGNPGEAECQREVESPDGMRSTVACNSEHRGTVTGSGLDDQQRPYVEVFVGKKGGGDGSLQRMDPDMLRRAQNPEIVAQLGPGDSFGELSLIYNTLREATFQAVEDSEVYVIGRRHFKAYFNRQGPHFKEYVALLDEVEALRPLVQAERWELACNAVGLFTFKPGEKVLTQGVPRKVCLWYVIHGGSCVMTADHCMPDGKVTRKTLGEIRRGGHFGERSLLRGGPNFIPEVNVRASDEGMTCLAFEGHGIQFLLEELFKDAAVEGANVSSSVEEYEQEKFSRSRRRAHTTKHAEVIWSKLQQVCLLGKGGFAEVFLVENRQTKQRYALKRLSKGHIERNHAVRQVCWERELLLLVESPFVIRLFRTFKDDQFVYLLMEAALGGSLYEALQTNPEVFCDDQPHGSASAFYVACILAAIEHLHDRRIVYRDLKPENVLLNEPGYARLCDMGFARFVLGKTNTLAGTPEYMAPEVIDFPHAHDMSADWWSLGVLTFELMAGQAPWEDDGISDPHGKLLAIRRSQEKEPRYPFSCPALVRNFISRLMTKLPRRLGVKDGAKELREHVWFQHLKFDFQALQAQTLPTPFSRTFRIPENEQEDVLELKAGMPSSQRSSLFVECRPQTGKARWDVEW
ncbi:unnamed protein product, partial [Polarella glacialis]